jgi:hypothetical protein
VDRLSRYIDEYFQAVEGRVAYTQFSFQNAVKKASHLLFACKRLVLRQRFFDLGPLLGSQLDFSIIVFKKVEQPETPLVADIPLAVSVYAQSPR